jgi:MscS family membrane protein
MKYFSRLCMAVAMLLSTAAAHAEIAGFSEFPDRSIPSATLTTFMNAADGIALRLETLEAARLRSQSSFYPQPSRAEQSVLSLLKEQATESLDLSRIPEGIRDSQGIETALMLREILHVAGYGKANLETRKVKEGLWVIVGTNLYIGMLTDGMRNGDYVFTKQTVAYVPSLYEKVVASKATGEFNAYSYYIETPGGLVPPIWAGLVMNLPKVWRQVYFGNTLWQWSAFALCLAAIVFAPQNLARFAKTRAKRRTVHAASMALIAAASGSFLTREINLTGMSEFICLIIFNLAFYFPMAFCVFMASEWLARNMSRLSRLDPANVDASMIRLFCRVLGIAGSIAVLALGASRLGMPVLGIIAGLGVGGLAVALAAQPTIENLLAGIVLYLDGSVRAGDHIEAGDVKGVIEQIGMRSTRLRGADGAMISMTNADLASRIVKNHSRKIAMASMKAGRKKRAA